MNTVETRKGFPIDSPHVDLNGGSGLRPTMRGTQIATMELARIYEQEIHEKSIPVPLPPRCRHTCRSRC